MTFFKKTTSVTPLVSKRSSLYGYNSDIYSIQHIETLKDRINKMYYNKYVQLFSFLLILFSLFSEEIKYIWVSPKYDDVFSGLTIFMLCFFLFELIISCWLIPGYYNSIDFYLDLFATLSLIIDIFGLYEKIITSNDATVISKPLDYGVSIKFNTNAARILRLIRFFRIGKVLSALRIRHPVELEYFFKIIFRDCPSMVSDLLTQQIIRILLICIIFTIIITVFLDELL